MDGGVTNKNAVHLNAGADVLVAEIMFLKQKIRTQTILIVMMMN
jgi:pentose-5-phosphate-3-epimerase